jgi:hypothetical protein
LKGLEQSLILTGLPKIAVQPEPEKWQIIGENGQKS